MPKETTPSPIAPEFPERQDSVGLLYDDPALVDEFGSHAKLAATILELILRQDRGAAIALRGAYGSGKSTVIRLLQRSLTDRVRMVVFDAWYHSGDSLRRAFLERLVEELCNEPTWIDKEKSKKLLQALSGQRKKETKQTTPYLTPVGFLVVIVASLVPIGAALVRILEGVGFAFAFLLITGPVLFGGSLYIFNLIRLNDPDQADARPTTKRGRMAKAASLSLTLLTNQTTQEVLTETIAEPEPTTLEFEALYRGIIEESLGVDSSRRLILVIDNLDRLTSEESHSIWATLSAFIDVNSSKHKGLQRVWLLAPVDPKSIAASDSPGLDPKHLFPKLFQLTYVVPRPILSKWKEFFDKKLHSLLPGLSAEVKHSLYRVFLLSRNNTETPTPREIAVFLNDFTALYRMRGQEIPVESLGYYAANQRIVDWTIEQIINLRVPIDRKLEAMLGSDYIINLAAIHFGVPVGEAPEVLYGARIEKYLLGSDDDPADVSGREGFWLVFESFIEPRLFESDFRNGLVRAINLIATMAALPFEQPVRKSIEQIKTAVLATDSWPALNKDLSTALHFIGSRVDAAPERARLLNVALLSNITESDAVSPVAAFLGTFIKASEEDSTWKEALLQTQTALPAGQYITLLLMLAEDGISPGQLCLFDTQRSSEDVAMGISALAEVSGAGQKLLQAARLLTQAGIDVDWKEAAKHVANAVRREIDDTTNCADLWSVLDELERTDHSNVQDKKALIQEGFALRLLLDLHLLAEAASGGMVLFDIVWFLPALESHDKSLVSNRYDTDLYVALAEDEAGEKIICCSLRQANGWEVLPKYFSSLMGLSTGSDLAARALSCLVENNLQGQLDVKLFLDDGAYTELSKEKGYDQLVAALCEKDLMEQLLAKDFSVKLLPLFAEIGNLFDSDSPHFETLRVILDGALQTFEMTDWNSQLENGSGLLALAATMMRKGARFDVGGVLVQLLSTAPEENDLPSIEGEKLERFLVLQELLSDDGRVTVGRNLIGQLISKPNECELIPRLYHTVLQEELLREKADELVRLLLIPGVTDRDASLIKLACDLLDGNLGVIKSAKRESLTVLRSALENYDDVDQNACLLKLKEFLGQRPRRSSKKAGVDS